MFKRVVTSERASCGSSWHAEASGPREKESASGRRACPRLHRALAFLLLATSGAAGRCDVFAEGRRAGLRPRARRASLVIPTARHKRLDGMRNILENPHVG